MPRPLARIACILTLVLVAGPLGGCYTMTHTVGNGGVGTAQVSRQQWYALWGLIPVNAKDTKEMAGGATDYTVETQASPLDIILNVFTVWVSFVSRTETVTK